MKIAISPMTISARLALLLALLAAVLMAVTLPAAEPARAAATFIVNSTGDQGDANFADGRCDTDPATSGNQCTLRAAIEEANETPGADAIHFGIGGSGVKSISPSSSQLPTITEAVTIDGYTQPGAKENTKTVGTDAVLLIEIHQSTLEFPSGLEIDAPNVVVRGLAINSFESGIVVLGADARIEGNFLGTDASGTQAPGNVDGVAVNSLNATVGGATPAARNLISGNTFQGVLLSSSTGAKVQGNIIGTTKDGTSPLVNGVGPGDSDGVKVGGSNNVVGGSVPGEANTIAFNTGAGVSVSSGTGNRILRNSIFANGRPGIDLVGGTENTAGASQNDLEDPDTGPNDLQNKPALFSASTSGSSITIKGKLNSTPKKTFALQFFSNPSGDEGKQFVAQRTVTTNANGNAPFSFDFAKAIPAGGRITATATGAGGTSEFSAPREATVQ